MLKLLVFCGVIDSVVTGSDQTDIMPYMEMQSWDVTLSDTTVTTDGYFDMSSQLNKGCLSDMLLLFIRSVVVVQYNIGTLLS